MSSERNGLTREFQFCGQLIPCSGRPQAWARGSTCPRLEKVVSVWCMRVKRSVDELFMYYFLNICRPTPDPYRAPFMDTTGERKPQTP